MFDWKAVALVMSGIAIGCVTMRATEPGSVARADEPGKHCVWGGLQVDATGPDFSDRGFQHMTDDGAELKAISPTNWYVFERCR
ncbi:MAG: hypothetical protein U1F43_36890 [Myxococcota bacterium]